MMIDFFFGTELALLTGRKELVASPNFLQRA